MALLVISAAPLSASAESIFANIPENAGVANGSASIEEYDSKLKKAQLEEAGKKELKAAYWETCGPWKVMASQRDIVKKIVEVETEWEGEKGAAVKKEIEALSDNKKIVAAVGAISNRSVSCSLYWFNIYGSDGTVLKLRYNMGD